MARYRKLRRTSDRRRALVRSQVTVLLYHGHTGTTETRTKEARKAAERLIAMAVKEKDNYEIVKVIAKVIHENRDSKRAKEVANDKKVIVYDEVEKEIKRDMSSRLHIRRQMLKVLYGATEVPSIPVGKKKNTEPADMVVKLFDDIAPKYTSRNDDYIRIVKVGLREGDAAMEVLIELVQSKL